MNEGSPSVQYFRWAQGDAMDLFLPILRPHLSFSNSLYNRMKAPHNTPSQHCVFAATFPPGTKTPPSIYTILFSDRSRHEESQVWTFNPLNTTTCSFPTEHNNILTAHISSMVLFLKNLTVREAPGWPFSPIIKFAAMHEYFTTILVKISRPLEALPRHTEWNQWIVNTSIIASLPSLKKGLPEGYSITRIPDDQIDIVISTSSIPRETSTYKLLPSVGILNPEGKLVAWGYIGIEGALATLYVLPEDRGKGLSSLVARTLVQKLREGEFAGIGFDGDSGWVHADVYDGNAGSEAVMKGLGASIACVSSFIWIDTSKWPEQGVQ